MEAGLIVVTDEVGVAAEHEPHNVEVRVDVWTTVGSLEVAGMIALLGKVIVVTGAFDFVIVGMAVDCDAGAMISLAARVIVVRGESSDDCAMTVAMKAEKNSEPNCMTGGERVYRG